MIDLSTRSRLILLVALCASPALVLTLYNATEQRAMAEAHAREDLQRLARLAATQQEQIIEGARQMMVPFAQTIGPLLRDQRACDQYFSNVLAGTRGLYLAMGVARVDGELFCSGPRPARSVNLSKRLFFRVAVSAGQFTVGGYHVNLTTAAPAITFGYPVLDATETIVAVIYAGLDLRRLDELAAATPLPQGATLTIVDRKGIVLAQHPKTGDQIGAKPRDARVFETVLRGRSGVFEAPGADEVPALHGYESVGENADGSIPFRTTVSIPKRLIFADANRALIRDLILIAFAVLLLIAGASYGAELFVLRDIRKLLDTERRVRAGDLAARTGFRSAKAELAQLGSAFDEMAQSLQDRDARLQHVMRELHDQAITDPLTALYNRRYLWDVLPREIMRAARKDARVAAIMIDIDHFKDVNDTYGHEAGDVVLKEIGKVIKENIRGSDTAYRYGGEELVVLLPEVTLDATLERAEEIRKAIATMQLSLRGRAIPRVTVSLGVAVYPDHGGDPDSLLRAADASLYMAKANGRNRVIAASAKETFPNDKPTDLSGPNH